MAYRIVEGNYILTYVSPNTGKRVGSKPDGDTVWFRPNNSDHLKNLGGRSAEIKPGGQAALRLEGVDALELHYPGQQHQKIEESIDARNFLLKSLGFTHVEYSGTNNEGSTVRSSTPESTPGYILTRKVDPNGRPIAFAFSGTAPGTDGTDFHLSPSFVGKSVNAKLMAAGWVYPMFYQSMPPDLRDRFTALAVDAFNDDSGLWPVDTSNEFNRIRSVADLEALALWPKLHRRLIDFLLETGGPLSGFDQWIRTEGKDDSLLIIPTADAAANMHDIYEISGDRIRMKFFPEELVVKET